jgi:ribonuclease T1
MRRIRFVMLTLLVALAAIALWQQPPPADAPEARASIPATDRVAPPPPVVVEPGLPPEVADTLARIAAGGPHPYDRDGLVFNNFERRLPERPRGWYHEYTVPTPGLDHRGARRIVTGGEPAAEFWYTDDHYQTFRRIGGARD